ncbi:LysR substrate-binding domain-containing protein [Roseateles puraquae]|jgi:DNA-binding transcriptional LysR family regulator|uniref:LysR family transcriptional regulator n=1 Tax=Roseateles puraquae TaxID=431059 RepID=A0A254MZ56_9BURK|nr:LysR substrate-binding domain-containing protein [Roseateles puraquae]MDG0856979.1 LysR family transcriptional regulator [Roseateles puraquae]OWQ98160.1 LysR family transcriptional regulator [Roseateles puraquae]
MDSNLELGALRVFLQVAELAHFSRAADELGLPKGRVSQVVRDLESRLGTRLFLRTTRRVSLTADGELLAERARALLADASDIEALFQQDQQLKGRLRVDLPVRLALDVVLPGLPAFLAQHPGLNVELSCTDRRVDLVEEGFDCVLRVGAVHDPLLVARPLGQMRMVNVASPAYLAARGTPLTPDDLLAQGHELVHYSQTWADRRARFEWVDAAGKEHALTLPSRVTVNNTDAYQAATLAGAGIAQFPVQGVRQALAEGRLRPVLAGYEPAPLPVRLVMSQRRHTPRRVRVFMDWLAGRLGDRLDPT